MEPSHSELDEYCKFQRYQYAPAHEMSRALASGRGSVPLCFTKQSNFLKGFLHCGADTIIRLAFTPSFAGLDALIVKHMSTPRHVPGAILFIA